ncbi:lectin-like domain-containing protein [Vagococcus fluvialis]|uniref:MucBP domain-containing protein n=1 Tax=Vagococcus fluvialis TaxID=2738 RepID=A0A7X6D9S7_9ENTE|nr:MucBP domain-containing protein [Vagococcus fluvialis]NKC68416.1 hypothetical protein [Vagococcus fluvialis]
MIKKGKIAFLFSLFICFSFENLTNAEAPPVPGDTEVLSDVFRIPNGTGPNLLTDKVLQITPAVNSQNGSIWSKDKIDLKKDFQISAYLYLGNSFGNAADGITFTLQNDSRMNTTSEKSVLGDSGMGLGAYANRSGGNYIRNAISVEFDTYYNNGTTNRMDREVNQNGGKGHLGVVTPKSNNNNYSGEHSAIVLAPDYLSNGTWRELQFKWDSTKQTINFSLEGVGSNSYEIRNLSTQFGSDTVYWGFTASTGGKNAENLIAISELPQKFTNEATIINKTTQIGPGVTTTATRGDKLELKSTIKTSPFVNVDNYKSSIVEIKIPEGISPDLESIRVGEDVIPVNRIEYKNNIVTIFDINLSQSGTTPIVIDADVLSRESDVTLISDFTLFDFDYNELSKSNEVSIKIPKIETGSVIIKYLDIDNNVVKKEEKISGNVGDEFEIEPAVIDGYQLIETIGNTKGSFENSIQTIVFKYKKAQFNLIQSVKKIDDSDASLASIEDTLVYKVELESLFNNELNNILYETMNIKNQLPESLIDISNIELKTKNNQMIGNADYDEENHCVIGQILIDDQLIRSEDVILSFQAKIKPDTVENTTIKVNAEANVLYSNGLDSGLVKSNEVSTRVDGGVYLLSAPKQIDFGTVTYDATVKKIDDGIYDQSLIVSDTRIKKSKWSLSAKLISQMSLINNADIELVDSLQYVNGDKTLILSENLQPIYTTAENSEEMDRIVNISDTWGSTKDSNGIKLVIDPTKSKITNGQYTGEIEWQLMEATP